jgi:hypothetical protein
MSCERAALCNGMHFPFGIDLEIEVSVSHHGGMQGRTEDASFRRLILGVRPVHRGAEPDDDSIRGASQCAA